MGYEKPVREGESMKGKWKVLCLTVILLLTACGQKDTGDNAAPNSENTQQMARSEFDWRIGEWKSDLTDGSAHTLYLSEYNEGLENDLDGERSTQYCAWGSNLYSLDCFSSDSGGDRIQQLYYLDCYEGTTGEIWRHSVSLPAMPDYEGMEKVISAFDIVNEQELVLFVQVRQDGNNKAYLALHMSMDEESPAGADAVDLQHAMQENGVQLEGALSFSDIYVDCQGYYYVIPQEQQGRVIVLGPDGDLTGQLDAGRNGISVRFACKDPDGAPIFKWYDEWEGTLRLVGYEPGAGSKIFAEAQLPWDGPMVLTEDGYLYYGDADGNLYRWDLDTGSREFCLDYGTMGIGSNHYRVRMSIGPDGEPVLLDYAGERARIYCMSTEFQQQTVSIRLVSMLPECEYVFTCAAEFSREHGDCEITVEKPEWDGVDIEQYFSGMETFRTRAMAELMAGDGADLYLVSKADMKILYEQGALADLTGVLPAELEKCIFPGVLEGGVIDGRQIGLTPEAAATIALVSNELWPEDSWTLEEALDLVEANAQLEYLLVDRSYNNGAGNLLYNVFLQDLDNSPFLNLEEGTCDFDNPLFIRLLEHVKGYGSFRNWESDPLDEGIAAGFFETTGNYPGFTYIMAKYGDRYHVAGFPTAGESGNYWSSDYYLVMNKDTPYRDILEDYLKGLFDIKHQKYCESSVRNDLVSLLTRYEPGSNRDSDWVYDRGNGIYQTVYVKPGGSTWEQEYLDLMNSCVQKSDSLDEIIDIILEDASAYFDGSKDINTVVDIIQNRVQLYLDEQR